MMNHLSVEEQERAQRYRFEKDRRRYLGGVLLQKKTLARYLSCSPNEVSFERNQWGKPSLAQGHQSELQFSLSRSHQVTLLAVCNGAELGVDLEYGLGRNDEVLKVKEDFCHEEQDFIAQASKPLDSFFEIWARKEAYIKGIGRGLSHPLGEFDVTPGVQGEAAVVRDWSPEAPSKLWKVESVTLPESGYGAAIATPLSQPVIRLIETDCTELLNPLFDT